MPPGPGELWAFLLPGYLTTVAVELPVLLIGLSRSHSLRVRIGAGFWLTACTYPIVVLVLPHLVWQPFGRGVYLAVAETFAPAAECLLLTLAFHDRESWGGAGWWRDVAAVVAANLASFLAGEYLF